ncbi:MAG: hypothetical protein ACRDRR_02045 [Pseudonocardiaceae bacterium]
MIDRPATIPPGLRVELSRHQVIPGQSAKVDVQRSTLLPAPVEHLIRAWAEHGSDGQARI